MFGSDPLKIYYLFIMDDDDLEEMSPFQGFGPSWVSLHWAMEIIADLPGDIIERLSTPVQIAVQRTAGLRPLTWLPLNISALESLPANAFGPCTLIFSGLKNVAERIRIWKDSVEAQYLHVSPTEFGDISPDDLSLKALQDFCLRQLDVNQHLLNQGQKELAKKAAGDWSWPVTVLKTLEIKGHNVTAPNHMSLRRLGFTLKDGAGFIGDSESAYTLAITESALTVAHVRHEIGEHDVHALGRRPYGMILFEPAMFRHNYVRAWAKAKEWGDYNQAFRVLQRQQKLYSGDQRDFVTFVSESRQAQTILRERADELRTQTLGVGLYAAQTISPVVRLSPGVNHVFGALSAYARSVRAERHESRRKAGRLFSEIQRRLSDAIGNERLEMIGRMPGPIKIISDAPIEWLAIGNLPLSLARDCSRIPATPGNVMMGQLVPSQPISITPEDFRKVLLVSSFNDDDRLKDVMTRSMEIMRPRWEGVVELVQVKVSTVAEFTAALNDFDGQILIFDGHGIANDLDPISKIVIGNEKIDVWSLRGHVRCPPVVILSACDTQGVDATSHATVGNGFLSLGARTVLGTFLPVEGLNSASFVSRLMHRIAEYIPAVLKNVNRSITWNEVVSGMLRMSLSTEIITELVGHPGTADYNRIHLDANMDINTGRQEWFDNLIDRIAEVRSIDRSAAEKLVQKVVASSEAIKYVQLGNPETLVLANERLAERVIAARVDAKTSP